MNNNAAAVLLALAAARHVAGDVVVSRGELVEITCAQAVGFARRFARTLLTMCVTRLTINLSASNEAPETQ